MPLARALALFLLQAAPSPADEVVGRWKVSGRELVLEKDGSGSFADEEGQATLRWTYAQTGVVTLTFETGDRVECTFTQARDRGICRQLFRGIMVKENWKPRPPPPPYVPPPCNLHVVEGVSAGPVRLGMKKADLDKLPLELKREAKTPEWLTGGGYRVLISPTGTVARVRVEASDTNALCVDRAGPVKGDSCFPQMVTGGSLFECEPRGVRLVEGRFGRLESVEIFPPVVARVLGPDDCTILVKPGESVGKLRLGMTRAQAAQLGLGLAAADPQAMSLSAGPYLVNLFGPGDTVSSIKLSVEFAKDERVCLESQPIEKSWRRDDLCSRGFCGCTVTQDSRARGIAHASCAEGIVFDFGFDAPGALFGVEITAKQ